MPLMWSPTFSVDVTSIDQQHEGLTKALSDFFERVDGGMPPSEALPAFDAIIQAVRDHFTHEEKIMRNIGLASYERHKQQHDRLLLDAEGFRKTMPERLEAHDLAEVRDYLSHWLVRHMSVEDRLIRDHLLGNHPAFPEGEPVPAPLDAETAKPTILVVDDVPANIQVLAAILKSDYQVLFATSGEDALRVVRTKEPDLILLDVMMPDMDGFTVCAKLKANPILEHIPVIFVTAMGEVADETKGLEVGAIDYITKPVSPAIVRSRVRNHLELKQQRDLLRRIALVDGLTGIANRRRFDELFGHEWRRAQRRNAPLSLIMADVDHFKGYNDHYGHQAGDECLKAVAKAIGDQMSRSTDLAARYGGEEFVCLLSDTAESGAEQVAERIRSALVSLALPHEFSSAAGVVTVSLGVATTVPSQENIRDDLLALADYYLYEAKKTGRNRFCSGTIVPKRLPAEVG